MWCLPQLTNLESIDVWFIERCNGSATFVLPYQPTRREFIARLLHRWALLSRLSVTDLFG
jgi:hypothetical protein